MKIFSKLFELYLNKSNENHNIPYNLSTRP